MCNVLYEDTVNFLVDKLNEIEAAKHTAELDFAACSNVRLHP